MTGPGGPSMPVTPAMGATLGATLPATDGGVGGAPEFEDLEARSVGRFAVLRKLGEGGMGVVYAAFDERLARRVAIKLLRDVDHARLLREAQALARLSHPNVVQVYEVGEAHGRIFVAMEYVEGPTLTAWLAEKKRDASAILGVFLQAGAGLQAAHAGGLVHRDFKPGNVLVGDDGRARVLDFGLARAGDSLTDGEVPMGKKDLSVALTTPLTIAGTMMGTPAYMSPEQHASLPVDARSDQFGFCAALFEALYGERPYPGETLTELTQAIFGGKLRAPKPRPDVPAAVHAALIRGLAPEPDARWPGMEELLRVLAAGFRESAEIGDSRVWKWVGGGTLVVAVLTLVALEVMWERPDAVTAADNVRMALVMGVLGYGSAPWLWRKFRHRRGRTMVGIMLVFVTASVTLRISLWAIDASMAESVVVETLVYASIWGTLAVTQRIPWLLINPALLIGVLAAVQGLGLTLYALAISWVVALAAGTVVWVKAWPVEGAQAQP